MAIVGIHCRLAIFLHPIFGSHENNSYFCGMKQTSMTTPIYIVEEENLRKNLRLIADVARQADVEIILAFKAFALWKTFPIFREYISSTTASSLSEARLALEEFGAKAHTFSPAYTDDEIDDIVKCSSHLTFNSLSQYERFHDRVAGKASIGLRVMRCPPPDSAT